MKILFLDIETAPDVVWTWGVYQENAIAVKEHWYVLSFAYKWAGAPGVHVRALNDFKGYTSGNKKEKYLLKEIHALLSEADIVVAHNGAQFDVRKLNARFIDHKFKPTPPYHIVDTKRDLVHVAQFSSNRLNWLAKQLGLGQKTMEHHDWKMWQGCMNGDPACWKEMKTYNAHDIVLLEELYHRIAPWIRQPNALLWSKAEHPICSNPACGSKRLFSNGIRYAKTRAYRRFQCRDCGHWTRATISEKDMRATRVPTA